MNQETGVKAIIGVYLSVFAFSVSAFAGLVSDNPVLVAVAKFAFNLK